jgi:formylglycine-generating enzyme required for sulfatase activity
MKRLLLLAILALAACVPAKVDIPATAAVAIRLTDEAMPTSTAAVTATPIRTPSPAPSPTATLGIGDSRVRAKDNAVMLYVPAGEFQMGYDQGNVDEQPVHTVNLDAFWIDRTEVTTGMYDACMQAGKCPKVAGMQPSSDLPVYNIDWQSANAYCSYAGARLPTEAEWEKAARGTDGRLYPWGMDLDTAKLSLFEGAGTLPPVGSAAYGAGPYGVQDMAGSAFEWVADWYSPTYYASSPHDNPTGPSSGAVHVIRGGLWQVCQNEREWMHCGTPIYRSTLRNSWGAYGRVGWGALPGQPISEWHYKTGAGFRCADGAQP